MRFALLSAAVFISACVVTINAQDNPNNEQVSPTVGIDVSGPTVSSHGTVQYFSYGNGNFSGYHRIFATTGGSVITEKTLSTLTTYSGDISGSGQASECYRATVYAAGVFGISNSATSGQKCLDPPPSSDPPPDIQDGCNPQCSPIVINFAEGGYRLTGANAPVLFDMSGDGHPTLMGWTEAGADEAFLWLDRNHNHRVTGGAELFGNFTPLQDGHLAKNGFEALAEFDANHDGVIDDRDPVWPQLMLWRDLNHNGVSEPNEISPLDASGVTAIDLHYHWTGRYDSWGNAFRYESLISIKNPSGRAARKQPVYDIFFVSMPQ
jgi:hypothetical protein